ncbi:MAG: hypothetical protein HOE90_23370 [Bacteriovoracaceae bacterium]|jgi:hypothetical protein|nr:hypothetical protein [Bacteriovoracaceae bacterium]
MRSIRHFFLLSTLIIATVVSPLANSTKVEESELLVQASKEVLVMNFDDGDVEAQLGISIDIGLSLKIKKTDQEGNSTEESTISTDINFLSATLRRGVSNEDIRYIEVEVASVNIDDKARLDLFSIKIDKDRDLGTLISIGTYAINLLDYQTKNQRAAVKITLGNTLFEIMKSNNPATPMGDRTLYWLPLVRANITAVYHATPRLTLEAMVETTIYLTPRGLGDGIESTLMEGILAEGLVRANYRILADGLYAYGQVGFQANYLNVDYSHASDEIFARDFVPYAGVGLEVRFGCRRKKCGGK